MSNKRKQQLTTSPEWAKHLRKIGKRFFWKGERLAERKQIEKEIETNTVTEDFPKILSRLNEIEHKLSVLRSVDSTFKVFGSEHHKYELGRTITENEIIAFEQKHRISLPFDYRSFILRFGDAACGPFYGLLTIEKGVYDLPQNIRDSDIIMLSNPFRFISPWNRESIIGDVDFQEDEYDDVKWCDGMLRICHAGCGHFINIVVTGTEYGNIWHDGRASDEGIFPLSFGDKGQKYSFLDWYINWLDSAIKESKS